MANAKITTETKKTVTLTLTEDEAIALRIVTGKVGGTSDLRAATSRVFVALDAAGISSTSARYNELNKSVSGTLQTGVKDPYTEYVTRYLNSSALGAPTYPWSRY